MLRARDALLGADRVRGGISGGVIRLASPIMRSERRCMSSVMRGANLHPALLVARQARLRTPYFNFLPKNHRSMQSNWGGKTVFPCAEGVLPFLRKSKWTKRPLFGFSRGYFGDFSEYFSHNPSRVAVRAFRRAVSGGADAAEHSGDRVAHAGCSRLQRRCRLAVRVGRRIRRAAERGTSRAAR